MKKRLYVVEALLHPGECGVHDRNADYLVVEVTKIYRPEEYRLFVDRWNLMRSDGGFRFTDVHAYVVEYEDHESIQEYTELRASQPLSFFI